MKLQHLAVIFVIIVLPLTLILSAYIGTQIDTLTLQNQYDTKLIDATYDGIKAFELNASHNNVSNVADTLREDVNAAIATFMNSLAINFGVEGYNKDYLKQYVPAILFTLYDGYYIYAPTKTALGDYEYILQPYNYYTVRYKMDNNNDIVINYSLDNYIVVYGFINGNYWVKSGYLVKNTHDVKDTEYLKKYVPCINVGESTIEIKEVTVTNDEYNPDYVNSEDFSGQDNRTTSIYPRDDYYYVAPDSATKYYEEANEFTDWVEANLDWVTPACAMRENKPLKELYNDLYEEGGLDDIAGEFTSDDKIFVFNNDNNDPEDENSIFFQHKTNVIKASIQENLNQAITAYGGTEVSGTYDYKLPKLDVNEWDMVSTNICMLTFLQGMPVGTKYYNNYALVQSTTNKLYVSKDSLYFTGNDGCYHKIDCPKLDGDQITGFSNFEFEPKSVIKEKR